MKIYNYSDQLSNEDLSNTVLIKINDVHLFVDSKSCLESMIRIIDKILPKNFLNYKNIKNVDRSSSLTFIYRKKIINNYIDLYKKEIPIQFHNDLKLNEYCNYYDDADKLIYLTIIYRITKAIEDKNYLIINQYLKILGITPDFNYYVKSNEFITNNISSTKDLVDLQKTLIVILYNYIVDNKLHIFYNTPKIIGENFNLFKSSNSLIAIAFNELLSEIIYSYNYIKPIKCSFCGKEFFTSNKRIKLCSNTCKQLARKRTNDTYNNSSKGKKRNHECYKNKKNSN